MLGRSVAHLTIYLPAMALYLIVLPHIYGFSTLGHLPQLFALAAIFLLATSFMGQAVGAWFTRPENATILLLATSLPQFFMAGFAWPREAIPEVAAGVRPALPADTAIDGLVRINQLGATIWEVAHDWLGPWCLTIGYFILAVISAFAFKRTATCAGLIGAGDHCDRNHAYRAAPCLSSASSGSVGRAHRCREIDGSQGRAGGERPTRVDYGPRKAPVCTRVMYWQKLLRWS